MNKKVNKQIPVTTYNWGPCLIKLKIEEEYRKFLPNSFTENVS